MKYCMENKLEYVDTKQPLRQYIIIHVTTAMDGGVSLHYQNTITHHNYGAHIGTKHIDIDRKEYENKSRIY